MWMDKDSYSPQTMWVSKVIFSAEVCCTGTVITYGPSCLLQRLQWGVEREALRVRDSCTHLLQRLIHLLLRLQSLCHQLQQLQLPPVADLWGHQIDMENMYSSYDKTTWYHCLSSRGIHIMRLFCLIEKKYWKCSVNTELMVSLKKKLWWKLNLLPSPPLGIFATALSLKMFREILFSH